MNGPTVRYLLFFPCIAIIVLSVYGKSFSDSEKRSSAVRMAFLQSRGLTKTPPGFQVDHVIPLHLGGKDEVENLCLIGGNRLPVKEWAEKREETLRLWLQDNKKWLKKNGCRYEW